MFNQITPLVITYNESANIDRTVRKLKWAQRIVVVDSGSTDATLDMLRRYPQAEIVHRRFDDFAAQCNFGLSKIETEWVLSLDADYELSSALVSEIGTLQPTASISGYEARFTYRVKGRALRGTLYPPRVVLFRTTQGRYHQEGHSHRVELNGATLPLVATIYHDDRKPLVRWFGSQQLYACNEAEHLLVSRANELSTVDRIRLMAWPAPMLVFFYVLFIKGCILDGWPGWFYALQRTLAEIMLALEIIDRRRLTRTD